MENMKNASVEELAETDSMNLAAAQNVYDTLHSTGLATCDMERFMVQSVYKKAVRHRYCLI